MNAEDDIVDLSPNAAFGQLVMTGVIGNCRDLFEIRMDGGVPRYFVRDLQVPRDVYLAALETAHRCTFMPDFDTPDDAGLS